MDVLIVINETLKFLRKATMFEFTELDRGQKAPEATTTTNPTSTKYLPSAIHEDSRRLPSGYRTIFNLYVIENKSHKENGTAQ